MKRFSLLLPALLLCSTAFAAEPVTYDIKVVEDGHLVYGFTTTAPIGKGIHLESSQVDHKGQDMGLDYLNDKISIELSGNQVDDKGFLKSTLTLFDIEKYIDAVEGKKAPMLNLPAVAKSTLNTGISLVNGVPTGLSYTIGTSTSGKGEKSVEDPRTVVITATWIH